MGVTRSLSLWLAKGHHLNTAFAQSIRGIRKGFDINLQGTHHIAATLIRERMSSLLSSQSGEPAELAPSPPAAVLEPASARFAGRVFQQSYTKQKGQTAQKERMQHQHRAEQTTASFHRLLQLALSTAPQKIPGDCAW